MASRDLRVHIQALCSATQSAASGAREAASILSEGADETFSHRSWSISGTDKERREELVRSLRSHADKVLTHWQHRALGVASKSTLIRSPAHFRSVYDSILTMLESLGTPPDTSSVIDSLTQLLRETESPDLDCVRGTTDTLTQLVDAVHQISTPTPVGGEPTTPVSPRLCGDSTTVTMRSAIQVVVECLEGLWNRRVWAVDTPLEGVDPHKLHSDAYGVMSHAAHDLHLAREHLMASILQNLSRIVPPVAPLPWVSEEAALRRQTDEMLASAEELRGIAERFAKLAKPAAPCGVDGDTFRSGSSSWQEDWQPQENDVRVALVHLLRRETDLLSQRWIAAISTEVPSYKREGGDGVVSGELNRVLVDAMIERLRPSGDCASLMHICRRIVDRRSATMVPEAVQHATRLFAPVACALCADLLHVGRYNVQTLPLVNNQAMVREMLVDVVFQACDIIRMEFAIRALDQTNVLLPDSVYLPDGDNNTLTQQLRRRIPELLVNAEIAGRYVVDCHISAVGAVGRGWRCRDLLNDGAVVFLKTFRSQPDNGKPVHVAREELEGTERLSRVAHLMAHPNICRVHQVLRNVHMKVPRTGREVDNFYGIITDFCDGGELFNYVITSTTTKGLQPLKAFTEPQARYLFKQMMELLRELHCSEDPYFHGDLKLENFVVQGTTIKAIDYSAFRAVREHAGIRHWTESYISVFHDSPEAVDLWAVGIILLHLFTLEFTRNLKWVYRNARRLRFGTFWMELERFLPADHPLRCKDPGSCRELLNLIFVAEPRNSIRVASVLEHPWLQGEVPTHDEMSTVLRDRFQGIGGLMPTSAACFDLNVRDARDRPAAVEKARSLLADACGRDVLRRFVLATEEGAHCDAVIECWEPPETADSGFHRCSVFSDCGQRLWVVGRYECTVVASSDALGTAFQQLQVHWERGSSRLEFSDFSHLIMTAILAKEGGGR